jgi:DNA-nicking Smr family endonuclease
MPEAGSDPFQTMHEDDDKELFRRAVTGTKKLEQPRQAPDRPRPEARAKFRHADERAALDESLIHDAADLEVESGDEIAFRRDRVSDAVLRKLRRGGYSMADELDLHGLTSAEARGAVRDFLGESARRGLSCVRVVHGKGRGSGPRGPVLKNSVNRWLRKHDAVLAFCSAVPAHGGTGAIYVLLKTGNG